LLSSSPVNPGWKPDENQQIWFHSQNNANKFSKPTNRAEAKQKPDWTDKPMGEREREIDGSWKIGFVVLKFRSGRVKTALVEKCFARERERGKAEGWYRRVLGLAAEGW